MFKAIILFRTTTEILSRSRKSWLVAAQHWHQEIVQTGTKLRYYCPDKFSLKGSRDLICKKDGTWSAPLPQCIGT